MIIAFICFGTIVYYLMGGFTVSFPWTMNIILFLIGEVFFALGMGKFLKGNREYHEENIWIEDNPDI